MMTLKLIRVAKDGSGLTVRHSDGRKETVSFGLAQCRGKHSQWPAPDAESAEWRRIFVEASARLDPRNIDHGDAAGRNIVG